MLVGIEAFDDSSESHVNRCGEEGRGDQDERVLDGIEHDLVCLVASSCSDTVTNHFRYERLAWNY